MSTIVKYWQSLAAEYQSLKERILAIESSSAVRTLSEQYLYESMLKRRTDLLLAMGQEFPSVLERYLKLRENARPRDGGERT